jgi:hypothetical protein
VIQTGVGAVPDAILRLLGDRKDLGAHSGMFGDGLVDLVEAGVLTNARKEIDAGVSINGALIGTRRLYRMGAPQPGAAHVQRQVITHDAAVLGRLSRLVTINSAMEVDLTGQVNAEQSGPPIWAAPAGRSTSSAPDHDRPAVIRSSRWRLPPRVEPAQQDHVPASKRPGHHRAQPKWT